MDVPDRIHFFSYETGVSLELPVGFTEGDESAGGVAYVDHDDAAGVDRAAVIVTVAGPGVPGAERAAAEAMVAAAAEVVGREARDIDDEAVAVARLRYRDGLPGRPDGADGLLAADLAVTFAAVVFGGSLVTLTAVAPWTDRDRYSAGFAAAVDSCRFLLGEEAA